MGLLRVGRKIQLVLLIGTMIGTVVDSSSYNPRGWRPSGPSFSLQENKSRYKEYHNTPSSSYESPYSDMIPTTTITPSITNIEMKTTVTTTPRSREPTTPSNIDDEDAQINPALAIANSFAFNRPVYIYTGFPFHPGFTYVQ